MKAYKALILNPVSSAIVEEHSYLAIDEGKIVSVSNKKPDCEIIDLEGKAIIPGMIDTHTHLAQFNVMGKGGKEELLEWLSNYIFPEEARLKDKAYAQKTAKRFFNEMIANGTTAAAIYSSMHLEACNEAFKEAESLGIKAIIGKVMMDRNVPEREEAHDSVESSIKLCEKWNKKNNRLYYAFTPRFAPACTERLLKEIGKACSSNDAYVQTHLSENNQEIELVKKLFNKHYINVYKDAGLLGKKTIMAHCIHLPEGDAKILASTGTKVAHCPYSNTFLHSGTMPYFKWKKIGLTIGLGTDIAASPSLSMFGQMGSAIEASKMKVEEAFYLATLGGAKALGMGGRIGNFSKGKDADFVVIDAGMLGAKDSLGLLKLLCKKGSKDCVEKVYVEGLLKKDVN
ncbi:MAG: guanine deaminase [Candidatus Woesearchaeota archaeon]